MQQAPPAFSSSAVIPQIPGARRNRSCDLVLWTSSVVGGKIGILGVGVASEAASRRASGGLIGLTIENTLVELFPASQFPFFVTHQGAICRGYRAGKLMFAGRSFRRLVKSS